MIPRVFIPDSDGGQYVECPAALADHLHHLEQRANGAELALLKAQRMPTDPTDTTIAEIANALRLQFGHRACSPEQIVAFVFRMMLDAGWQRVEPPGAAAAEIHAETLIAVAAWCASEGSDDVAAAAAEVRAFVAACNDIGRRGGESLARTMAAAIPTDGELVCAHCGTPWGQRHSETCINVPAPRRAEPEVTGPDDPADLNPEPMNAPQQDSVRNENGSHR